MAGQSTELVSLLMASPRGEERGQRSVGQPNTQDNSGPREPAAQCMVHTHGTHRADRQWPAAVLSK